jgi:hypothetical protein
VKLTTHLRLVPRSKKGWSSTSTPPIRLHGVVLRGSTGTTPVTFPFLSPNILLSTILSTMLCFAFHP